jgi:hypothetical protein
MSSETGDLGLGMPPSADRSRGNRPDPEITPTDRLTAPAILPNAGGGSSSADGLTLSLSQGNPDPFLGEFEPMPPGVAIEGHAPTRRLAAIGDSGAEAFDLDVPPSAPVPGGAASGPGTSGIVADLDLDAGKPVAPKPSTAEHFATLDLSAPPPSKAEKAQTRGKVAPAKAEENDEDSDEDDRLPWWCAPRVVALIISYASAITLGLIWVLWSHRVARENGNAEPDLFTSAETAVDPGQRAGQSREYRPPTPLPPDRIVGLGETIRLELLEVTPLEIASGTVMLRHAIRQGVTKRGGDDALILKVRLKSLSSDLILVPLDETFLRARQRGVRDSFIESSSNRQIDMFPLAVVSEWSIAGQEFRELEPGESYDSVFVSAPGAVACLDSKNPMTWRVRLRVDLNKTEILGIRFRDQDIRRQLRRDRPDEREPTKRSEPDRDRPALSRDR